MEIKILGTGCAKCKKLEELTREVAEKNSIKATIIKVEDITEIMKYRVMSTPALVVNENVEFRGGLPSGPEVLRILLKYEGTEKNETVI